MYYFKVVRKQDEEIVQLLQSESLLKIQHYINNELSNEFNVEEISKFEFDKLSNNYQILTEDSEDSDSNSDQPLQDMYFAIWKLDDNSKDFPVEMFVANTVQEAIEKFNDYRAGETWYKLTRITKKQYIGYFKYVYSARDFDMMKQAELSRYLKKEHPNILYSVAQVREFFEKNTKAKHMLEKDYNQDMLGLNKDELVGWIADHDEFFDLFKKAIGLPNFKSKQVKQKN